MALENKRLGSVACLFAAALLLMIGCDRERDDFSMIGESMGTSFRVHCEPVGGLTELELKDHIDRCLGAIDAELSNWRSDSWVSRFNRLSVKQTIEIPGHAYAVLRLSLDLAEKTSGGLDPTVSPLVEFWGFGVAEVERVVPSQLDIDTAKLRCGYQHVYLDDQQQTVYKQVHGLELNLSAIAKGYAVDQVCEVLKALGAENYLVEIGGEVRAHGVNPSGLAWRVGVAKPVAGQVGAGVVGTVPLLNAALATSGSYQQFKRLDGRIYNHIIDPISGVPVGNGVLSVSVKAPVCALADGLATAGMVLGPANFMALIELMPEVEALVLTHQGGDAIQQTRSSGWMLGIGLD